MTATPHREPTRLLMVLSVLAGCVAGGPRLAGAVECSGPTVE
jgi:hypothetical protein